MHESEKQKWSRSAVSDSSRSHGLQPIRLLHPWDFPGKSTGVGCHCLLWRILEWEAIVFSRESSQPRDQTVSLTSPALAGSFFTTSTPWEAHFTYGNVCVSGLLSQFFPHSPWTTFVDAPLHISLFYSSRLQLPHPLLERCSNVCCYFSIIRKDCSSKWPEKNVQVEKTLVGGGVFAIESEYEDQKFNLF